MILTHDWSAMPFTPLSVLC